MSLIRNKIPAFAWDGGKPDEIDWEATEDSIMKWLGFGTPQAATDTIDIFDVIGQDEFWDEISDKFIADELAKREGQSVRLRINSPGGDVFTGLSIYNLLRQHNGKVTAEVTGVAASAASVIAMAADEVVMGDGAMIMIHNAWGMTVGNKYDHQDVYEVLDRIDNQMIGIYAARTGLGEDELAGLLKAETWMGHAEAIEAGFADSVNERNKVSASASKTDKNPMKDQRRIERALGRIGVPRNLRGDVIHLIREGTQRDASARTAERDAGNEPEIVHFMNDLISIFET